MKLIAGVLLMVAAASAPETRYFRYQRAVQVPGNAAGQTCVALDSQVFAHAAAGLGDLRLYRSGTETPYMLRDARSIPTIGQADQSIAPMNAGRREGKTVFDAAMPDGSYNDVTLDVGGHDFLATVTVFGGQDAADAKTRIGTYTIFDFDRQKLGRSTVLHLPLSNFRVLHFEVAGPVEPEQVHGLTPVRQAMEELRYVAVSQVSHSVQKRHSTVLEFTTQPGVPVDRIVFVPPAEPVNFSRDVQIESRPDTDGKHADSADVSIANWSGSVLRVHSEQSGHRIDEERLSIDMPAFSFSPTKWTVAVENGDDAPIAFSSVRLEMQERDLCFEATAGAAYMLYYGDGALAAPQYDYAKWFTPRERSAAAVTGAETLNATYESRPDMRPFTEKHPVLLWIALHAVVGVLGLIALRSVKRAPKPPAMP